VRVSGAISMRLSRFKAPACRGVNNMVILLSWVMCEHPLEVIPHCGFSSGITQIQTT
jgi:hypothetical protein